MAMRSRSEVAAARKATAPAVEQDRRTVAAKEACPACGFEQATGGADCERCGAGMRDDDQPAETPPGEERPPGGVDRGASTGATDKPTPRPPEQENLALLCEALAKHSIAAPLDCVAELQPGQRNVLAAWVLDGTIKQAQAAASLAALAERVSAKIARANGATSDPNATRRITGEEGTVARESLRRAGVAPYAPREGDVEAYAGGEVVSYTFGEEVYQTEPYCTFRVGPFTLSRPRRVGETRLDVLDELASDARSFAERERKSKADGFARALRGMRDGAR